MWKIRIAEGSVEIGERFAISFQRTLRIPDDGQVYPLPPTLGTFPVLRVQDYLERVPSTWRKGDGVFIPMYQQEAMWLAFEAASWKPNAVKIGVGGVNALTGDEWDQRMREASQDYLVCPNQPWLDGIKTGEDTIRQFVAMPLGEGYTIEGQLTGREQFGGLQVLVFDPKPGIFPDKPPPERGPGFGLGGPPLAFAEQPASIQEMGLAAGGQMVQKIYPDPFGFQTWDQSSYGELFVHIVNSAQYATITGKPPPPTPVSATTYNEYGLPWFELYDEGLGDLETTVKLAEVKSVGEIDAEAGIATDLEDFPIEIAPEQVRKIDPNESDLRT